MRSMRFKIAIEFDEKVYWPFWPFRTKRVVFVVPRAGFKVEVDQTTLNGYFTGNPVTLSGYVQQDGVVQTTTVDFKEGSRLRRVTKSL